MVKDALWCHVLWSSDEMTGGYCEECISERWTVLGSEGHYQLEMFPFVAVVELAF